MYAKYHGEYILAKNSKYTKLLDNVEIIHTTCGTHWVTRASHILYDSGCPKCNQSKGETLIDNILNKSSILHVRQYTIPECKHTKELPFDFAIVSTTGSLLGLIEYDGVQHFRSFKHFGGVNKFHKQQFNDKIKTDFCKTNDIPLLRVKYTSSDSKVKQLVLKFCSDVKSKAEELQPKL